MKIFLILILIWTLNACNGVEQENAVKGNEQKDFILPNDWKRINESSVEFFVPPDFIEKEETHIRGGKFYENGNIYLVFTIQSNFMGSERFSKERDFHLEKIIVDEKQAEISTFTGTDMVNEAEGRNYVVSLEIPKIKGNTKTLLMWAYSKTPQDREIVLRIFKSVKILD